MSYDGVIIGSTAASGDRIAEELGLDFWLVVSPRTLRNGALRGREISNPVVVIESDVVVTDDTRKALQSAFGRRSARIWRLSPVG